MGAPLVFLDTETTGLHPQDDDIWELAAMRRDPDGTLTELHMFVDHNEERCDKLPEPFLTDHLARYKLHRSLPRKEACRRFADLVGDDRPHIVGAVPNFDTERLAWMYGCEGAPCPTWHYHLIDVENLAVGWLFGQYRANQTTGIHRGLMPVGAASLALPWDSNALSKSVGVDPEQFERHTAMGDVRWAMAIYDAVTGGPK